MGRPTFTGRALTHAAEIDRAQYHRLLDVSSNRSVQVYGESFVG